MYQGCSPHLIEGEYPPTNIQHEFDGLSPHFTRGEHSHSNIQDEIKAFSQHPQSNVRVSNKEEVLLNSIDLIGSTMNIQNEIKNSPHFAKGEHPQSNNQR